MNSEIHKYPISLTESFEIDTSNSVGSPILVGLQNGEPWFWLIEAWPDKKTYRRKFTVVGTGHTIPENWNYVGSWQAPPFVWHLHEVYPQPS